VEAGRRVAIITGAAGGLGFAVSRLLVEQGRRVVMVDVAADRLAESARGLGELAAAAPADLRHVDECERVVSETVDRLGGVDILVNSAAILARTALEDADEAAFARIFETNCRSVFFLCRAAIKDMEKRGWGRVVNLTSIGVYMGGYSMTSALYEATKGAVAVFTKSFARYGAPRGILVNAVAPGAMRTGMILAETPEEIIRELETTIPVGRLAEPEEVAEVVVFLTGEQMTYAAGATFDVNGGLLMP
jgi:NAD(P)-dependent dehydrogenase (short-subunit alcohol dehydrogenase family)